MCQNISHLRTNCRPLIRILKCLLNIRISEPDANLFRTAVFKEYESAGMVAKWKPGLLARIQSVK